MFGGSCVGFDASARPLMDVGEPEVVPRDVPNSNRPADAIRQGTKSTCQLVVLSLGNSVNLGIVDAVSVIVRVARRAHGEAVVMAKTRRGCKELLTGYAAGDFENELIGIAGLLRGTDNIRSMGLIDLRWPEADIDNIETILSHVFDLYVPFSASACCILFTTCGRYLSMPRSCSITRKLRSRTGCCNCAAGGQCSPMRRNKQRTVTCCVVFCTTCTGQNSSGLANYCWGLR